MTFSRAEIEHWARTFGVGITDVPSAVLAREALPRWLVPELVATEAARHKLEQYAQAPQLDAETVAARLRYVGDPAMLGTIARTIAEKLPPPMAAYTLDRVVVAGVGALWRGFASAALGDGQRPWRVVLGPMPTVDEFDGLTVHELAHAWLEHEPTAEMRAPSALVDDTLRTWSGEIPPHAFGIVNAFRGESERRERRARALVRALGLRDPSEPDE